MSVAPEQIGLKQSQTDAPGYMRRLVNESWQYIKPCGDPVSKHQSQWITNLAIPPAWKDVWISPDPHTHILAYGEDEKGRRQYIYHPDFRNAREMAKYDGLTDFAQGLPRLRRRIDETLENSDDIEDLAIAAIIRILDETGLRIGHHRFRRQSGTRGLTTLSEDNIRVKGDEIRFAFRAKGGKDREVTFEDTDVARVMRVLKDEPGKDVFDGVDFSIRSQTVNRYIQNVMGEGFSAKYFRTWGGSVVATEAIRKKDAETLKAVAEAAADYLGNTASIAQNSYIHPAILDIVREGRELPPPAGPTRLYANERACFGIITDSAKQE